MSGNWEKAYSRGSGGRRREKEAPVVVRSVEVSFHVKLREYTTIGIGGAADRMAFPRSPAQVREVVLAEGAAGREVRVLGAGSNLLVADGGVSATVLCTRKHLSKVVFLSDETVVVEAGVMLPRLAVLCALSGLSGMEPLSGIPGAGGDTGDRGAGDPVRVPGSGVPRSGDRGPGGVPVRSRDAGDRVRTDAADEREASEQATAGREDLRIHAPQSPGGEGEGRAVAGASGDEGRAGRGRLLLREARQLPREPGMRHRGRRPSAHF